MKRLVLIALAVAFPVMAIDFKNWFNKDWLYSPISKLATGWSNLSNTQKWTFAGSFGLGSLAFGYNWYKKSSNNIQPQELKKHAYAMTELQFDMDEAKVISDYIRRHKAGQLNVVKKEIVHKDYPNGWSLDVSMDPNQNKVEIDAKYREVNDGYTWHKRRITILSIENNEVREHFDDDAGTLE